MIISMKVCCLTGFELTAFLLQSFMHLVLITLDLVCMSDFFLRIAIVI